jgi:hypothetical protein
MRYFLILGRVIGIVGGIWFLYQILRTIQRAGQSLWYSPISNLLNLGIVFILGVLLLLPWKSIKKLRLWGFAFSLFVIVSVFYLISLILGIPNGGASNIFLSSIIVIFLTLQGLCFFFIDRQSKNKT